MWHRIHSIRLSTKVAMFTMLLSGLATALFVYFTVRGLTDNLTTLLVHQQRSALRFVANDLEQKMLLRTASLQDVADRLPDLGESSVEALDRFLSQRIAIFRLFSNGVVVIDRHGKGLVDYPPVEGRRQGRFEALEYFQEVMRTGQPAIGKPRVGRFTKEPGVAIAVPVRGRDGVVQGVMAGFLHLNDKRLFDQGMAKLGLSGHYVLISNADTLVLADTGRQHPWAPLQDVSGTWLARAIADSTDWIDVTDGPDNQQWLVSDMPILSGRWTLVGMMPASEAWAPIHAFVSNTYVLAAGCIAVYGVLVWWLLRSQLGIVTRSTRALRTMAESEVGIRQLPNQRVDEIGELIDAFNLMADKIHARDRALQQVTERFQNLFVHMNNGFALHEMMFDAAGKPVDYRFLEVNPAFERMTGLTGEHVVGRTALEVIPALEPEWIERYGRVVQTRVPVTFENYAAALDRYYQVTSYSPEDGKFAVIVEDVTALRQAQQELKRMAYHDGLTGLPNRTLFSDRLEQAIASANRHQVNLAVCYMDLDRFKAVNDTYGHETGDLLLIEVARRLRNRLRAGDSVSRFGGDEFALLLTDIRSESELMELAQKILDAVAQPCQLGTVTLTISMSMGIALYPEDDAHMETLLGHADEALYAAKRAGRNRVKRYARPLA